MSLATYLNPSPRTIWLKGEREHYDEARASVLVKPGYLIELEAAGTMKPNATSAGDATRAVAIEDGLQGLTIEDNYAIGDLVRYVVCEPGDEVQMRVPAGAAAIVIGDALKSNGDGTLIKQGGAGTILFYATQAVDNSGGGTEAFICVRAK
jgi:hypothetical protein